MKDTNFTTITLLFFLVLYLGAKVIKNRSNELSYENDISILKNKVDSLNQAYGKLEFYTIDVENICDKYKSSRDAKYNYHLQVK